MTQELPRLTPMLRQYFEIKQSVGDAVLFFRMGDFFEIFGDDAELIAPKLDIVLTAREKGDQTKIPFCGVPHHSAKSYWLKLVKLGYKVAICEQLEDASKATGLVKRGVTRVYSPGSIDELEGLEQELPNYLLAWMDVPGSQTEILAAVDVSTGEFRLGSIEPGQLTRYVRQFRPSELLVRRFAMAPVTKAIEAWTRENQLHLDEIPEAPLKDDVLQRELLAEVFGHADISKQPSGMVVGGGALASAVIQYLRTLKSSTAQFLRIERLEEPDSVPLSETVIRDLEIFETSRRRQSDGSLARVIDRTLSPMGARALRYALSHPLTKKESVLNRHMAVGDLVSAGEAALSDIRAELRHAPDLARLATRILTGAASPHELALARNALAKANALSPKILAVAGDGSRLESLASELVAGSDVLAVLAEVLIDQPEGLGSGRGVFRSGLDRFLDEKNLLAANGQQEVERYEEVLRKQTGISSLKVRSHKSFGLLLEVSKSNVSKVPPDFIRRQTMTNGERYTTMALKELDDALANALDQATQREAQMYQELIARLKPYRDGLVQVAKALGELDMLQCFAWLAVRENYARPVLTDRPRRLTLKGCRHPVVEKFVGKHEFVPNDVLMSDMKNQILITGPNMAGKSTVMRQTALAAILCQAGSWVPAHEAEMPVFDRIFTRVGASDDLSRGQSTFMVEMSEAAEILRYATNRSLVILDEVGRGTSTTDGLAIAAGIMDALTERVGCFTMFATHYHELVPMMSAHGNVVPMQTQVIEKDDGIVFTHRLVAGASASSFGIEVAKLAGIPAFVIERAKHYLSQSEQRLGDGAQMSVDNALRQGACAKTEEKPLSKVQQGLFGLPETNWAADTLSEQPAHGDLNRLIAKLEGVKIHKTTPLQALNILNELKSMLVPVQHRSLFDEDSSRTL